MMTQRRPKSKRNTAGRKQLDCLGLRLQNLRSLQNTTQLSLAKQLGIGQTALSHMERRDDILLSTLKAYVEALGDQLHVAATFPDADAVSLVGDRIGSERMSQARSRCRLTTSFPFPVFLARPSLLLRQGT
jgi:transcriptional regulator with XRE-family HTH domain